MKNVSLYLTPIRERERWAAASQGDTLPLGLWAGKLTRNKGAGCHQQSKTRQQLDYLCYYHVITLLAMTPPFWIKNHEPIQCETRPSKKCLPVQDKSQTLKQTKTNLQYFQDSIQYLEEHTQEDWTPVGPWRRLVDTQCSRVRPISQARNCLSAKRDNQLKVTPAMLHQRRRSASKAAQSQLGGNCTQSGWAPVTQFQGESQQSRDFARGHSQLNSPAFTSRCTTPLESQ